MALSAGTRLGPYEIVAPLGAGGMGEVYRARDTKLGRDVALKILPDSFTHDPERLARFRREAQVLASLNHPHIGAIYGLDDANGQQFLVLEFIDGVTLADRITEGRLPLDEALTIARQIAEALAAAHEKGIIHRDLKPANIALTRDGNVKVLDFGLAKPTDAATGVSSDLANSPTITSPAMMTGVGVILGTAAYMSPEQAKGKAADKRSDVWAFGCVLYEMLTGTRAFKGEDVSDTLAAVLKSDPDWSAMPPALAPSIRSLVEGCLKKDRRERIGDLSTALFLLNQPTSVATAPAVNRPASRRWWRDAVLVACGVGVATAVAAAISFWKLKSSSPAAPPPVTRFALTLPEGQQLITQASRPVVAISPDGSRMAYAADDRLYLRSMAEGEIRAIAGTDAGTSPAFSPDGQSLVFLVDRTLKRIAVGGGVPVTVGQVPPYADFSWSNDGILFSQQGTGVMRIPPNGGTPEVLVRVSSADGLVSGPQMLPDGESLLFAIASATASADRWDKARVMVQSLKTGVRKMLIDGGTDARYVPTGHIVYVQHGTLFAVPFNLARLEVTGGHVPMVEGVRRVNANALNGTAHFAFSNSGSLVYLAGPTSADQLDLFLFDRKGAREALKLPPAYYGYPRVSPDGKRLAFETTDGKDVAVSIYELSGTSAVRRLTFGGNNRFPIWSADGQRVAFQSDREGDLGVFWQPVNGGTAERLTKPDAGTSHVPESWSRTGEGDLLLFSVANQAGISLWMVSVADGKARPFDDVRSISLPTDAVFSPDGHWVAYQTGELSGGEGTTYVQPFPPTGPKYQIARGGRPVWSRDGKELFYVPGPGRLMAVTIRPQPSFTFTNPVAVPRGFGEAAPANPRTFDTLPQSRIVGVGPVGPGHTGTAEWSPQIQVVVNWFEELKARVPTK